MAENNKMRVAIQGYEGSFHHIVAERYFGEDIYDRAVRYVPRSRPSGRNR